MKWKYSSFLVGWALPTTPSPCSYNILKKLDLLLNWFSLHLVRLNFDSASFLKRVAMSRSEIKIGSSTGMILLNYSIESGSDRPLAPT